MSSERDIMDVTPRPRDIDSVVLSPGQATEFLEGEARAREERADRLEARLRAALAVPTIGDQPELAELGVRAPRVDASEVGSAQRQIERLRTEARRIRFFIAHADGRPVTVDSQVMYRLRAFER